MYHTVLLLTLPLDWQKALSLTIRSLSQVGLRVARSFDLQVARAAHLDCTCPHHGTEECDCQLIVLLVYDQQNPPATLVAHSRDGRTEFALVETPLQQPNPQLQAAIRQALKADNFYHQNYGSWVDVS